MKINLSEPFDRVVADALTLPARGEDGHISDQIVVEMVRYLYSKAHGRGVDTSIGRITVAPATAAFLKNAPVIVRSRDELLVLALNYKHLNGNGLRNGHATVSRT